MLQNQIEGYHELSSQMYMYFSTSTARWVLGTDFYFKVVDNVHQSLG